MSMTNNDPTRDQPARVLPIHRFHDGVVSQVDDSVAVEAPLEIRLVFGPDDDRRSKSLSITMRTPGHDHELAAGFLQAENIVQTAGQIRSIEHCGPAPRQAPDGHGNTLMVELTADVEFSPAQLQRHFYMTSSCGVCGKASIDAVIAQGFKRIDHTINVDPEIIKRMPDQLRQQQSVFDLTGGIHAAGLFDSDGNLLALREDVGRHNAVDKLVGSQMFEHPRAFPEPARILLVSGRASFELVQKALSASFEMLVAVGPPSSLAVDLASEFGLTLLGFTSANRFNIYTGLERVRFRDTSAS